MGAPCNLTDAADALSYTMKGTKMGCDIHWYSETKRNDKWQCDQADSFELIKESTYTYPNMEEFPNSERDYSFFGLLQPGVRSEWGWSFPERHEIPNDLSKEVQSMSDDWKGDSHSHGYLTRKELKAKLEELKQSRTMHLIAPTEVTHTLHHHVEELEDTIANLTADVPDTDQRIVFWFDN